MNVVRKLLELLDNFCYMWYYHKGQQRAITVTD